MNSSLIPYQFTLRLNSKKLLLVKFYVTSKENIHDYLKSLIKYFELQI